MDPRKCQLGNSQATKLNMFRNFKRNAPSAVLTFEWIWVSCQQIICKVWDITIKYDLSWNCFCFLSFKNKSGMAYEEIHLIAMVGLYML